MHVQAAFRLLDAGQWDAQVGDAVLVDVPIGFGERLRRRRSGDLQRARGGAGSEDEQKPTGARSVYVRTRLGRGAEHDARNVDARRLRRQAQAKQRQEWNQTGSSHDKSRNWLKVPEESAFQMGPPRSVAKSSWPVVVYGNGGRIFPVAPGLESWL